MFTISIIGRANVGKSTLFNKLIGQRKAIESKIPGTTRDQNRGFVLWKKKEFAIIDTPGLELYNKNNQSILEKVYPGQKKEIIELETNIQKQIEKAMKIADLIIFVIDVRNGLLPQDLKTAAMLRKLNPVKNSRDKSNKPIILAANKCDSLKWQQETLGYYNLGLGEPIALSALTGAGINDLIEKILSIAKTKSNNLVLAEPKRVDTSISSSRHIGLSLRIGQTQGLPLRNKSFIKIAIVGKPNVGKSSLFNAIACEDISTVSALPHTTRDIQDIIISYKNYNFLLIDTAGLRRKNRSKKASILEKFSIAKSQEAIKKSDICFLLIETNSRLSRQDAALSKIIFQEHKSLIIIGTKWDCILNRNQKSVQEFQKYFRNSFPYLSWAPILFTAVPTRNKAKVYIPPGELKPNLLDQEKVLADPQYQPMAKILDLAIIVWQNFNRPISQTELNNFLKWVIRHHRPQKGRGTKFPRILNLEQVDITPPWFKIIIPEKTNISQAYLNFLEKKLQQRFNLQGAPVKVSVGHIG